MNLFKSYTYTWKQIGIFKLSLLAIGMILGAYFADFVKGNLVIFVVIAVAATTFIMYISVRQAD